MITWCGIPEEFCARPIRWQPRWFVLAGGTLSYYDSQEEAFKGCKGSIKISVCEIQVHPSDFTRVDLTIPGEQYFYLRAINAAERQKWLVALGTAKACLTDNRTRKEKEIQENTEVLKTKMSELRLYCDLLLEQVNKLKESPLSEGAVGSGETGKESGGLVKSTCDTFLKTLEECMQIASRAFSPELQNLSPPETPPVATIKPHKIKSSNHKSHHLEEKSELLTANAGENLHPEKTSNPQKSQEAEPKAHGLESESDLEKEDRVETFFSSMSHRFSDIRLEDDSGIPTRDFLDSCFAIVPVLDKLGPTVFAPVKMDFVGNIKKVQQKLQSDPDNFPTLQSIVLHEVRMEVAQVRNSATEALLWLKRGLKFLKEFLSEVDAGEQDIHAALNNAYGKTLRQYHGWVVRGVFALALRAAPSYSGFMAALVCHEEDLLKENFMSGMHRDLAIYLPAMEKQLAILDALYEEYGLESDEVV
ncbi:Pleckstrin homology domain-containing family A member 8 [Bagarius yarrelli]|uniref:Pleckstrin homology domain-containing family A member 8 n=1 Tax=Bagarius yarrelli TaxID=175774 RepID=A0A556TPX2_BAGYA|nr:Pleckstrin homology domain-containing family A member 8 [Bagarius yarrelli]